ncbi:hypothetical protein VN97_g12187 [Penicillium thymicola]|uniref:Uncharacterized protein n=1 Tax=Penicillium thymicola TaxID=293382 RepID=A0AAI9X2P7_PENTH|nr:hypothetical protein VN97_g12187 [Penicillium thymicola]
MAPNVPKVDTNRAKDKRKENAVSKSASRRAAMERKSQLNKRKIAQSQSQDSQRKQLKDLQKKINATKALLSEEEDEEKQGELEVSLKELLSSYEQIERDLTAIEADIMDIDTNLKRIDQGGPMDVDDTEDENSGDGPDNENESNENSDRDQQNEVADQPETEVKFICHDDLANQQRSNESHPLPDIVVNSNELFVGQIERPSATQGASQQDHERPKDYKDYTFIDLTLDDDDGPSERLFENGTVTLKKNAGSGVDYLNSYGPLNCAMTIWSSNAAPNEVEGCTYIKGDPHNKAMFEDATGKLLYKGMIRNIKKVAWQPRREGSAGPAASAPLWISRTNYKKLSSSAKKESLRTDRRIYVVALVQVKNYRNWAGKLLDNKWTGEKRVGLAQSPTPFPETLETENILLRGKGDQDQNKKSDNYQDQRTQDPSTELENSQSQNTWSQSNEREHSQAQNSETESIQDQGNAASPTDSPQFSNENPVAHEKKSERSPQQTFNRKKFLDDILGMIDDFKNLPMETQMEMRALALAQYDLYKRKMEEGGAKEETV